MKQLLLAAFLFQCITASPQSIIKGKANNEDENVISNATVILKSGRISTTALADSNGVFTIDNLASGTYQLEVSSSGFDSYEARVRMKENEALDLGVLKLIGRYNQLQNVEVMGRTSRKYSSDYSFGATKTATLNKDIP